MSAVLITAAATGIGCVTAETLAAAGPTEPFDWRLGFAETLELKR